jgi:hypothetical protein
MELPFTESDVHPSEAPEIHFITVWNTHKNLVRNFYR